MNTVDNRISLFKTSLKHTAFLMDYPKSRASLSVVGVCWCGSLEFLVARFFISIIPFVFLFE